MPRVINLEAAVRKRLLHLEQRFDEIFAEMHRLKKVLKALETKPDGRKLRH